MKVVAQTGREDIAMLYIAEFEGGGLVECVEAVQPPTPRAQKWVLLVSTTFGCPVGCQMCDAGGYYYGKLSAEQMLAQIDYLVAQRYPDGHIPSRQFKIQLARMGEPALNDAVLDVLEELPQRYHAPGLMPSLSTIAPHGRDAFFERLLEIKNKHYSGGRFQFQFSLHTTDESRRDELIPVRKWSFAQMAAFGERFYRPGERKVTLNFALAQSNPLDPQVLRRSFDPDIFLVKLTPLNPTYRAQENGLVTTIGGEDRRREQQLVGALEQVGYQVIVSIGELEENRIGSNCGQYVQRHLQAHAPLERGYTYTVQPVTVD